MTVFFFRFRDLVFPARTSQRQRVPIRLSAGLLFLQALLILPVQAASSLSLDYCHLDGIRTQVQCGTLSVPENYAEENGTRLDIRVAVLPSYSASPLPDPLVFLAGGPGQSAVEVAPMIHRAFHDVLADRDIVLIDQRGTGGSSPLQCEDEIDAYGTVETDFKQEDIQRCIDSFDVDLSQYNTENAIRDFEAVRAALGYEQINIYGGSYGTRAGLVYMRMFPDSLRTSVLDSLGPLQIPIGHFGRSAARSFNKTLEECAAQTACAAAYPDLRGDFERLIQMFDDGPVTLSVPNPSTAEPMTYKLSRNKVVNMLRLQLYSTQGRAMIPAVIHAAAEGNFLPLLGINAQANAGNGIYVGLTLNIVCNEDFFRLSPEVLAQDADNDFGGAASHWLWNIACPVWPKYSVEPDYVEPVQSAIPSLLLSGGFDPVTPPSNAEAALEGLSNARHFAVANGAHTVAFHSCAPRLIREFLDERSATELDGSCLEKVSSADFVLNLNGSK